jgi:hypothetical protein
MNSGNSLTIYKLIRLGLQWLRAVRMICRIWMISILKLKKNRKMAPPPPMLRRNLQRMKSTSLLIGFTFKNLTSDRPIVSRRNTQPYAQS